MEPRDPAELWRFLSIAYFCTVALELPVLAIGLSSRHSWRTRIIAAFWLTACTYPMVALVFPLVIEPSFGYVTYLVVAETFAPLAECLLFYAAFDRTATRVELLRDMIAIVLANLVSFGVGFLVT